MHRRKLMEYLPRLLVPNPARNLALSARFACVIHPRADLFHVRHIRIGAGTILDACLIDANTEDRSGISIGKDCLIHRDVVMRAMEGSIEIGDRVSIQHFCAMYGHGRLEIGADVLIGPHCAIAVARHRVERLDIPVREQGVLRLDTHIGAGTWIGAHVTVFSGVRVGANAIIGAGAVVNRDIPDLAIAAGVPARVIRYRNA